MTALKSHHMSHRTLLITLVLLALPAWGGLLLFTRLIAPGGVLAFLGFFCLLGIGLLSTLIPLIYLVAHSILVARSARPRLSQVTRQASLISIWIVFNLLLRLLHSWSIFTAMVSFGIIVVIEFLALGRN
jgi:heme exporter protein D